MCDLLFIKHTELRSEDQSEAHGLIHTICWGKYMGVKEN